ncbi:(2Fe-2S)-binding protein [Candidatus Roizmanbacteria bacterium CG22_combo_CG10-13_8_21_14_all_38_20]|uniref:(2Fe-2S)-binding protein n=1 Tax=Candidatus Roizmanbacteria bacterium CG22_combo_CG10-13_8_21_14_all_38_20 TaxID=1974862 RepID=A0A2H0BVP1_9BACT|nr:non-heme iron oxygenase ferredoxin subunit [Candidatus Microgenomates bacterium]PIP61038.1 MAG: (2Fe-2S)-binding protein [Candidatus Roizmanbacteria bacterium CG22_combo_CG10-13_8_21_14_all_38_20]PJC30654.1 MAG: (2Fe-2S)-binding protein [Candidatus Roizmanbacteria bacterium CG_4_9_14_0_2_um_filter_38_17]
MAFIKIAKVNQIRDGEVKKFIVKDKIIAVANVGGDFFVIDDTCSHAKCSLSKGVLSGKELACPCHGAKFDVKTGKALTLPATVPVASYEVKIEKDNIMVRIFP